MTHNIKKLYYLILLFLPAFLVFDSCETVTDHQEERRNQRIVLTFDDAVKSHFNYVAPLLKALNFNATFFVTYAFMDDGEHFLTWEEIAALDSMGFEIGNHSWTHPDFGQPIHAAQLAGELGLMNYQLGLYGIPKPVSFAWTGNGFGPEAIDVLREQGIRYARRGMQPEVPFGSKQAGPAYDPMVHHPLLIPTTRDFYPEITFEDFKASLDKADDHEIVVLQFHGVPDLVHPWVHTDPGLFEQCMNYLKENRYEVLAMRELGEYLPAALPRDSLLGYRHVLGDPDKLHWPQEVVASRKMPEYWISNMLRHGYSIAEMSEVLAWPVDKIRAEIKEKDLQPTKKVNNRLQVLPYPGGRHPRIGFKEGMLSPMRGTKASVFLPWDSGNYIVLDLPEAIFSQYGLNFLGHTHIPTVYDIKKQWIENRDWEIHQDGRITNQWTLPDGLTIGAAILPQTDHVRMDLWLYNARQDTILTDLRTQVCLMLKGAGDYSDLTNDNKRMNTVAVAVESDEDNPSIIMAWDRCYHVWGNENSPCMHADPLFADCAPNDTVRVRGKVWFAPENKVNLEMQKTEEVFTVVDRLP